MTTASCGCRRLPGAGHPQKELILEKLTRSSDVRNSPARKREKVERLMEKVRRKGYATRQTGYFITQPTEARVSAIAVPVMDGDFAMGSVNLVWISQAATEAQFVDVHLSRLLDAARDIGAAYSKRAASG